MSIVKKIDLQPTLIGPSIVLRPLQADDLESLYEAASDPLIWEQHPDSLRYQRDAFYTRFFATGMASGGALIALDKESNKVIGSSRFYDWNEERKEIAIGYTFLIRSHWGGGTNREMKSLMLTHAFQWAETVWFHIGSTNERSRRAMEKMGGIFSHEEQKESNGALQSTSFYKMLREQELSWLGRF